MMEKLKPCPFCGEKAELSSGRFDGKDTSYVTCRKCGSCGEFFIVNPKYASAEKAIKAWNTRVTIETEPQWIQVSERLPKKPNVYTVTDSKGDVVRFVFDNTESSREYWLRCAKAWMPLPKPYKEEE